MKYKLVVAVAAVVILSSAYAFWQNDKSPLPVVAGNGTNQPAQAVNQLPGAPQSANQKPQVVAGVSKKSKSPNTSLDSLPVPAPVDDSTQALPDTVHLWQPEENDPNTTVDGLPATRLRVDPERLRQFHVGQTLTLEIPQEGTAFEAQITSTHNNPTGVKVWRADIADALEEAGVIITQGKLQTHMVIASEQGNYSVVIDNKTGESTLIDESEINARQAPFDDGIAVGPPEESTLPPIN